MKNRQTLGVAFALVLIGSGCKTTDTYTRTDKSKRRVEIYSSGDHRTAMANPSEDSGLAGSKSRLESDVKKNPQDKTAWLNLANLNLASGNLQAAEDACKKALRVDIKNQDAKLVLAQIALRRNQMELANILLNGLGGDKSNDPQVLNMLAIIALSENEPWRATNYFKKALDIDPGNVSVRMNFGVLNLKYRQLSAAAIQFERVLKIMPENPDAKLHLAIIKASRGEYANAEKIYNEVLSSKKDNPLALYNLAVVQKQQEEYSDALDNLKTYLKTAHGKSADTEQVLALIETIKDLKVQKNGDSKVSDEEIQELAKNLETEPVTKVAKGPKQPTAVEGEVDALPSSEPEVTPAKAEAPQQKDEIEDLERALTE